MTMEKDLTALEVLGIAIKAEMDAHDFYVNMAGRIKNRVVKQRIMGLAADERTHEGILKKLYRDWTGEKHVPVAPKGPIALSELNTDEMSYEELLEKAIELERDAVKRYIEASKKSQDDSGMRTLQYLAEFERTHERVLVSELDCLKQNSDWFDDETFPGSDRPVHLGP